MIIVGTGIYSQHVTTAALNPITKGDLDGSSDTTLAYNVAYTFHFYPGIYSEGHTVSGLGGEATGGKNSGLSVFVTEWGQNYSSSPFSGWSDEWKQWLVDNKFSSCNWSVHNKGGEDTNWSIIQGTDVNNLRLTEPGNKMKTFMENNASGWGGD